MNYCNCSDYSVLNDRRVETAMWGKNEYAETGAGDVWKDSPVVPASSAGFPAVWQSSSWNTFFPSRRQLNLTSFPRAGSPTGRSWLTTMTMRLAGCFCFSRFECYCHVRIILKLQIRLPGWQLQNKSWFKFRKGITQSFWQHNVELTTTQKPTGWCKGRVKLVCECVFPQLSHSVDCVSSSPLSSSSESAETFFILIMAALMLRSSSLCPLLWTSERAWTICSITTFYSAFTVSGSILTHAKHQTKIKDKSTSRLYILVVSKMQTFLIILAKGTDEHQLIRSHENVFFFLN